MRDLTYNQAIKNAKHLKALRQSEVYLIGCEDAPWQHVEKVERGCMIRMGMNVSANFIARDPKTGLRFHWSFDIEQSKANGKGYYDIDTAAIARVMRLLPESGKKSFRVFLKECATTAQAKADEWQAIASQQSVYAAALRGF